MGHGVVQRSQPRIESKGRNCRHRRTVQLMLAVFVMPSLGLGEFEVACRRCPSTSGRGSLSPCTGLSPTALAELDADQRHIQVLCARQGSKARAGAVSRRLAARSLQVGALPRWRQAGRIARGGRRRPAGRTSLLVLAGHHHVKVIPAGGLSVPVGLPTHTAARCRRTTLHTGAVTPCPPPPAGRNLHLRHAAHQLAHALAQPLLQARTNA